MLCLFPEGLRTLDGKIAEFKKGFAILAKASGAKLIPVFIDGAYQAWPRTAKFPRLYPIKVTFGPPVSPDKLKDKDYQAICTITREALIDLG